MITSFFKRKKAAMLLVLLALPFGVLAQRSVLDNYVDSAIVNNIVLRQKNISLERARVAFQIAKSYYLPTTAFQLNYQTADGGRSIPLPLGDLLNGVYNTLNSLTSGKQFPQIANQNFQFLPKNYYDARIHTTLPVYDPDIMYGKRLADQQIRLSQLELDIYQKDLIKNIKEAYFNYLLSLQSVNIYKQSLVLAEEGRRTNQKLLDNGKGLPAYVIRSASEKENIQAQINTAEQQVKNAALYFNFLLNRDLKSPIDTDYNASSAAAEAKALLGMDYSISGRSEIKALEQTSLIYRTTLDMNKAAYYPRLNTFLDLGTQSQDWRVNGDSRYYLFGAQLEVPIFSGLRTRRRIRQAQLDLENAALDISQARQQLSMRSESAKNELFAAISTLSAKEKQLESAAVYQRLVERGYQEGSNTFIETIDARNQYTQASIARQIQLFQVLISAADVQRNLESSPIQK